MVSIQHRDGPCPLFPRGHLDEGVSLGPARGLIPDDLDRYHPTSPLEERSEFIKADMLFQIAHV